MAKKYFNIYPWLVDKDYATNAKEILVKLYEDYYKATDKEEKDELFKELEIYLSVVCDVIAYRYLVKHYTNLFYKLCITVDEYMDYKVKRLLVTIKEKKERIEDILSYIYMSFMLSSPRLIYDYAEKIGRCQLVKETKPYYQVARDRFFNNKESNEIEHIIYNVDTLYLDDDQTNSNDSIRSNLDKFSHHQWQDKVRMENDGYNDFEKLVNVIQNLSENEYLKKSKEYLLYLFSNWKTEIESDYQMVKINNKFGNTYSLVDYIKFKQENNQTNLSTEEYINVLKILNLLLKGR